MRLSIKLVCVCDWSFVHVCVLRVCRGIPRLSLFPSFEGHSCLLWLVTLTSTQLLPQGSVDPQGSVWARNWIRVQAEGSGTQYLWSAHNSILKFLTGFLKSQQLEETHESPRLWRFNVRFKKRLMTLLHLKASLYPLYLLYRITCKMCIDMHNEDFDYFWMHHLLTWTWLLMEIYTIM